MNVHEKLSAPLRGAEHYNQIDPSTNVRKKLDTTYAKDYEDLEDLRLNISAFIECYYNRERLHSALGYRSPQEFEEATDSSDAASISIVAKLKFAH